MFFDEPFKEAPCHSVRSHAERVRTLDLLRDDLNFVVAAIGYTGSVTLGLVELDRGVWARALRLFGTRIEFAAGIDWEAEAPSARRWIIVHELAHLAAPFFNRGAGAFGEESHTLGFALTLSALQCRAAGEYRLRSYDCRGAGLDDTTLNAWLQQHAPELANSSRTAAEIGCAAYWRAWRFHQQPHWRGRARIALAVAAGVAVLAWGAHK